MIMSTDEEKRKDNERKKQERINNPEKVRKKYREWSSNNRAGIKKRIVEQKEQQRQKTNDLPILPQQSRAARGMLDWTQADLAAASLLGKSTIRNFEVQHHETTSANLSAIMNAFTSAGVIFETGKFIGVKIRR